jgi:hypothetical protein
MLKRAICFALLQMTVLDASEWLLIRRTDGTQVEGRADLSAIALESDGRPIKLKPAEIFSIQNGSPASDFESQRIQADLTNVQGKDRAARDLAVEELTAIGLPALTPLLQALKDTDQHEPRPLYRLFERIMPSYADAPDRSLSLVRLQNGSALRGKLPDASVQLKTADGHATEVPWSGIRSLAIRKKMVHRSMPVHSLRHCTQIEYLDTGVVVSPASRADISAAGFVRLSWNEDGWASDPDGLKKPGSPAYKTNLVAGQPFGALVGRIGANGEMFFVGRKTSKTGLPSGRLGLAINDNAHWQNNLGAYSVTMTATDAYDLGDPQ